MQLMVEKLGPQREARVLPIAADGLVCRRNGRSLIDGVSLTLDARHAVTCILGPNGAGKSILLRLLAGLVAPDAGRVTWQGIAPSKERALRIGFVFQKPVLLRRTARENIEFVLRLAGESGASLQHRAQELLEQAALTRVAHSPARFLSGGEQQRLALARAMGQSPEILFLDEPASTLDPRSAAAVEDMIGALRLSAIPVVLVTHDLGQARRLADRIVFMNNGRIFERERAASFFAAPKTREAKAYLSGDIVT